MEAEKLKIVTNWMLELGVPAHLNGYGYLRDAILVTCHDMESVCSVTKLLYPAVAKRNHVTASKVERSIRNAIEVSWERGKAELFDEIFGYSRITGSLRPTNSEYIGRIADAIRIKYENMEW